MLLVLNMLSMCTMITNVTNFTVFIHNFPTQYIHKLYLNTVQNYIINT